MRTNENAIVGEIRYSPLASKTCLFKVMSLSSLDKNAFRRARKFAGVDARKLVF